MENKKLIRFVESFILLPMMTMSMPLGTVPNTELAMVPRLQIVSTQIEYSDAEVKLAFNQALEQKQNILDTQAEAIDAYFKKYHMPLLGTGAKMAKEADENGLDWRLLPAIAVRESTGGKHACTSVSHAFFGWGSCKISFKSDAEAIEVVAKHLSGNHKETARYYSDKTIKEILQRYNPPSVVPNYAAQVMKIMDDIGDPEILTIPNASVS